MWFDLKKSFIYKYFNTFYDNFLIWIDSTFGSLSWIQTTAQMNMIHLGGNTSIYNNKIVVSGGYNETDNVYKLTGTIEAYDNEKNKWEIVACMPQPVFWHKCSSVYR